MEKNIVDEIIQIKDVLPKKQRMLCNYLAIHYVEAGMMTVAQLAEASGVGTTTVIRLMKTLRYENYSDFKRDLLNLSLMRNTSSYRGIKQSFQSASSKPGKDVLDTLLLDTTRTMENIITSKNMDQLHKAVQMMIEARMIYVLGLRSSKSAALYLETTIDRFYPKIRQLSNESEFLCDKACRLTPEDVLITFSVWPCTRKTIEITDICHQQGIPIILVTNTTLNPVAKYANVVIDTNSVNSGCGILPIMFVAEALVAELGLQTAPESTECLEKMEQMLDHHHVFLTDRS